MEDLRNVTPKTKVERRNIHGIFKKKWQSQMSKDDLRPLGRFDCTFSQKKILNTLVESVVHTTAFM